MQYYAILCQHEALKGKHWIQMVRCCSLSSWQADLMCPIGSSLQQHPTSPSPRLHNFHRSQRLKFRPQDEMIHEWKLLHHSWINIDAIPWLAALAWGEKKEPKKRN